MGTACQILRIRSIAALVAGAALSCAAAAQVTLSGLRVAPVAYKTDYSFDLSHGSTPAAQLLQTKSGRYYGSTQNGGAHGSGAVFQFDPSTSRIRVLHSFIQDGHDGIQPIGNLVEDEEGAIYGTTSLGGAYFNGTVFRMSDDGAYQVVHAFQGGPTDGMQSYSALVKGRDGFFYGTTSFGGANGQGNRGLPP